LQVRRRRWARGGRSALLLASLAVLVTGCSAHDWEKKLRFGWPTGVTEQGTKMRVLWTWSGVAALALGVVVWGLIFWACLRYRKKNDEIPTQFKYNFAIEMVTLIFPFLVIGVLFWRTVVVEDNVNKTSGAHNPNVVYIQVDAFKWNWQFEYHRDLGQKLLSYPGRTNEISREEGKPLYLSTVGSDTEIPVLVIPVGKKVQVIEHSFDVIHSFWVPEFLFKRDVIPFNARATQNDPTATAHDNKFEFKAFETGSFVGRCAELCGTYHSEMNFEVRVVSYEDFERYLDALRTIGPDNPARQSMALKAITDPRYNKPYATTTIPFVTDRTVKHATPEG
jgi:cytochrome c oxidase subunit 2